MSVNHQNVSSSLNRIVREAGLTFTEFNDTPDSTSYPMVGDKSIKFWNIWPRSGPKLDKALLLGNQYLRPLGFQLACHNYNRMVPQLSQVTGEMVEIPKPVFSLLVKPLPEYMK